MCLKITRIKKFQSSLRNLSQGIALGHDKFPAEIPPPKSVFTAKFWSKVRYSYAWSRIVSGKLWKLEGVDDECRHTGEQVSNRFSLRGKLESLVNCWSGSWADEGAFVVESSRRWKRGRIGIERRRREKEIRNGCSTKVGAGGSRDRSRWTKSIRGTSRTTLPDDFKEGPRGLGWHVVDIRVRGRDKVIITGGSLKLKIVGRARGNISS